MQRRARSTKAKTTIRRKKKAIFELTSTRHNVVRIVNGLLMMPVMALVHPVATAAVLAVDLGTASSFAVLASSTITNTGTTTIRGDVGLHPGTSITGGPVVLEGMIHLTDATANTAKVALAAAYIDAAGRAFTTRYTVPTDLTGPERFFASALNDFTARPPGRIPLPTATATAISHPVSQPFGLLSN